MQVRHQKASRHAMSRNVTEDEIKISAINDHVAVIAADQSCRLIDMINAPSAVFDVTLRQQPALYLGGELQVVFECRLLFARKFIEADSCERIGKHHFDIHCLMT